VQNLRTIAAALALSVAVFLTARWLLEPPLQPLKPPLPTFHRVDVNDPQFKLQSSFVSDNDPERDALRRAVLDAADALKDDPCDDSLKARYIVAAVNCARAWLKMSPCVGTRTCGQSDLARLELTQKAFGTPADHRVREAMSRVHMSGAIFKGDFPADAAVVLANLAPGPGINPNASPEYEEVMEALGKTCRPSDAIGRRAQSR
jgi:hypothetical protein